MDRLGRVDDLLEELGSVVRELAASSAAAAAMKSGPQQRLFTVEQLCEVEPALTPGGVRRDLLRRQTNGLQASGALVQRGRRILLDRSRYLDWMAGKG